MREVISPAESLVQTSKTKRRLRVWLVVSLLLSISLQIIGFVVVKPVGPYDATEYLAIGRSLARGQGYSISGVSFPDFPEFRGESPTRMRQPGYPLFLALFYWLLGGHLIVVQLLQLVMNALTLYITFRIALSIWGDRLWPGTLLILGLYYPLWVSSASVLTECLFAFTLIAFMLLLRTALRTGRTFEFVLAGVVLGCAFLTRTTALAVCILALIPMWLQLGRRKGLVGWSVMAAAFLVTMSPWAIRNSLACGALTPFPTTGGYCVWSSAVNDDQSRWTDNAEMRRLVGHGYYQDYQASRRFQKAGIVLIAEQPSDYMIRAVKRSIASWTHFPESPLFTAGPTAGRLLLCGQLLLLFGFCVGLVASRRIEALYVLLPLVSSTIVFIAVRPIGRYLVPAMPLMIVTAGQGLYALVHLIHESALTRHLDATAEHTLQSGPSHRLPVEHAETRQ